MDILTDIIEFIINFEIPFGDSTYKPVYFIYVSMAMALLSYLLSNQRKD